MKKQIHILQGIIIILVIFISFLLSVKFIYKINNEQVDTEYIWNINLTNLTISEGSVTGTTTLEDNTLTTTVTLKNESDYYEYTFDIENNGSIESILDSITLGIDNPKNILTHQVTYLDGTPINKGDTILPNSKKTILVRIDYPKQESKIYEELTLSISLNLKYIAKY